MEVDEAMPTRTEKRKVRFVVVSLENVIFAKQQGRGMGWDVFILRNFHGPRQSHF